jgi:hypothetical protein
MRVLPRRRESKRRANRKPMFCTALDSRLRGKTQNDESTRSVPPNDPRERAETTCRENAGSPHRTHIFVMATNSTYSPPDSAIATGSVNTHASAMLMTVRPCRPAPLATEAPATPDDRICVVETGRP